MDFDFGKIDFRHKTKEETEDYQKKFMSELYQKMVAEEFCGHIVLNNDGIVWKLQNGVIVKVYLNLPINEGYITCLYPDKGKEKELTHWHPSVDEIYGDLSDINTGNTFFAVKKNKFPTALPLIFEKQEWEKLGDKKRKCYELL